MGTFLLYTGNILLFALIPFFLAGLRKPYRLLYAYIYTSLVLFVGGFLGAVYAFPLTPTITISAGTITYGAFIMSTILIFMIERDLNVVRNMLGIIFGVNILKLLLFTIISNSLDGSNIINPFFTAPEVFSVSIKFMLIGGLLIIVELLLFIAIVERIKKHVENNILLSVVYIGFYIVILCLDGILFPLFAFPFEPQLTSIIAGGVQTKIVLAVSYGIPMLAFLAFYREEIKAYSTTTFKMQELLVPPERIQIKELEQGLQQSEARFIRIFQSSPMPISITSLVDGTIMDVNQSWEEMFGFAREEVVGKTSVELGIIPATAREQIVTSLNTHEGIRDLDTQVKLRSGEVRDILLSMENIEIDGDLVIISSMIDVTKRRKNEAALRTSEKALKKAQQVARVGSWAWYISENQVVWSDEMYRIFGIDPLTFSGDLAKVIEQAIHPDDRAAVEAANLRVMNEKTPLPLEYRVVWADGSVRTVWAEGGELVMDAEGEPLMLSGVVQDITDRKEMERQMKESEKKYRTFVETAHDLIWEVDAEGKITFMNPAANRIYGYAPEELIGKHWTTNSVKMDEEDAERLANQTQELGGTVEGQISIMRHRDGHRVILRANAVQIFDEGGEYLGAMGTSQDITDLIGLQEEIQQSRDRLRALTQHIQTAIEKERADLSRELHDEFGQILTGLKMDLTWLTKEGLPLSMNNPRVISMFELIDQAISITRRISSELRPSVLDDLGLLSALSWYTDEFVKRTNILCDLSLPGEDPPLDTNLQTDLFRIYQEALTNVARHAKASRVKTSFLTEDDAIIMHIQDNGQGIRPRELQNRKSLGLLGMSERAAKWQGTLDIDGVDGAGTTVSIHIPISQDS